MYSGVALHLQAIFRSKQMAFRKGVEGFWKKGSLQLEALWRSGEAALKKGSQGLRDGTDLAANKYPLLESGFDLVYKSLDSNRLYRLYVVGNLMFTAAVGVCVVNLDEKLIEQGRDHIVKLNEARIALERWSIRQGDEKKVLLDRVGELEAWKANILKAAAENPHLATFIMRLVRHEAGEPSRSKD